VQGSGRGLILRHYPRISVGAEEKLQKNLSQDSRPPSRDLNPGPLEYEAGMLTTRPQRLGVKSRLQNTRMNYKFSNVHCRAQHKWNNSGR
jgi:hypothetical protein